MDKISGKNFLISINIPSLEGASGNEPDPCPYSFKWRQMLPEGELPRKQAHTPPLSFIIEIFPSISYLCVFLLLVHFTVLGGIYNGMLKTLRDQE